MLSPQPDHDALIEENDLTDAPVFSAADAEKFSRVREYWLSRREKELLIASNLRISMKAAESEAAFCKNILLMLDRAEDDKKQARREVVNRIANGGSAS